VGTSSSSAICAGSAGAYGDNRERLLRMTRLERFLDRPAGQLSGGMRQKLALICTLIHLPDVLLLDEPTTGVDPVSRRDFWSIIHTLVASRGVTVLMTTAYGGRARLPPGEPHARWRGDRGGPDS
jgi:ABC-2 type transport system ATP-binding protein